MVIHLSGVVTRQGVSSGRLTREVKAAPIGLSHVGGKRVHNVHFGALRRLYLTLHYRPKSLLRIVDRRSTQGRFKLS